MPIDDPDVRYAFDSAQELLETSPVSLGLDEENSVHADALRTHIYCEIMRLYAVSHHPEILKILESLCEQINPTITRVRFRAYLARVKTEKVSPLGIIGWANRYKPHIETMMRPYTDAATPSSTFTPPNTNEFTPPIEHATAEDFEAVLHHGDNPHDTMAEIDEMLEQEQCDRALECSLRLPMSDRDEIQRRDRYLDEVATLALRQNRDDIAEQCVKRLKEDKRRALILAKLFQRTKRVDFQAELEMLVANERPSSDDEWQVSVATILSETTGNPWILKTVQLRVQQNRRQIQKEREIDLDDAVNTNNEEQENEEDREFELFNKRLDAFGQHPSPILLSTLEEQAVAATSATERAERFLDIWKRTNHPRHLERARASAREIPIDDYDLRAVSNDLYLATKDLRDLERWREAIHSIHKPLQRLDKLIEFCEDKAMLQAT